MNQLFLFFIINHLYICNYFKFSDELIFINSDEYLVNIKKKKKILLMPCKNGN
jgi:hypothetical protein